MSATHDVDQDTGGAEQKDGPETLHTLQPVEINEDPWLNYVFRKELTITMCRVAALS